MKRNPLYVFNDLDSTGIYNVPLNSTIQINDSDGNGTPKVLQFIDRTGMQPETTIEQMLTNFPGSYIDLNDAGEIPSELERIQSINTPGNYGWRLLDKNPNNFGDIGQYAVDFSNVFSFTGAGSQYGATGKLSLACGYKTTSSGYAAHAEGIETIAKNQASFVCGLFNKGSSSETIVEVGCGSGIGLRENAIEVYSNGRVLAPSLDLQTIGNGGPASLVTKEYSDNNLGSKLDTSGGIITGNLTIEGNDDNIPSFINQRKAVFEDEVSFLGPIKTGIDDASNSPIFFTDIDPNITPSIEWNSTQRDFIIRNPSTNAGLIWHSGNDGVGSELDAGKLGGYWANEYILLNDYQNSLDLKFDKAGGIIGGETTIDDDLIIIGSLTTEDLIINNQLYINDTLTIDGEAYFNGGLYVPGEFHPSTVNSDVDFINKSTFSGEIEANNDFNINGDIIINPNFGGRSQLGFINTVSNTTSHLFWDPTKQDFCIDIGDGISYKLWSEFNDSISNRVQSFDDLSDTPSQKEPGYYLRVKTDGSGFEYLQHVDATYLIDDTAEDGIYDKVWSASKVYNKMLGKLSTQGGTVYGSVDIHQSLVISEDLVVGRDFTVEGNLFLPGLPTADPGVQGQVWNDSGILKISV